MNPRTTGVLLLVALALGAFVWFYEIQGEAGRKQAEAQTRRLFPGIEAAQIDAISLRTSDGREARLERQDGRFRLVEPLAFPADAFAADGLASNLAGLEQESVIDAPQPPAEYGLGEDARVVRFRAGEQTHALRLGADTPVGPNAYASVEGRPEVYTVPRYTAKSFDKTLADLRERRILEFDTAAVRHVELSWPGEHVVLERTAAEADADAAGAGATAPGAKSVWRIVEPVKGPADDATVDRLLSDLAFLRADGFVDDPPPPAEAGLAPPAFEVTLVGPPPAEGAEALRVHLEIGGSYEGDERLVRAGQPSLYTIPAERFDALPRQVARYRYRRLAGFAAADAQQLDLFFQPASGDPVAVTAVRGEGGWSSSPERIAPGRIERLVAQLADLEASDVLTDAPQPEQLEALGLSPPKVVITVFGGVDEAKPTTAEPEAGEAPEPPALPRLAEVQIGRVQGSEWIVARAAGDPAVYRLPYEMSETIPVSLDALRNRFASEDAGPAALPPSGEPEFLSPSQESP